MYFDELHKKYMSNRRDKYWIGAGDGYYICIMVGGGWTDDEVDQFVEAEMTRLNQYIQKQIFWNPQFGKPWIPENE